MAEGTGPEAIRAAFARQAEACGRLGSPFMEWLMGAAPELIDPETEIGARVWGFPDPPWKEALPLRVAAGLHALARSGRRPGLTRAWPPRGEGDPGAEARAALAEEAAFLGPWLDGPPQTNEPGRSGVILMGMLELAARWRRPVEVLEIGSSAGLNLSFDRWSYDLGEGRRWGAADASLHLECPWEGAGPDLSAPLEIAARAGCDIRPNDPGTPEGALRIMSYAWPDQTARLARLEAAVAAAAEAPWRVERADAGAWLTERLAAPPEAPMGRVILHTIVWQYLPRATRDAARAAMARAAAEATEDRPLAWLRLEPDATPGSASVLLTAWPGGAAEELGRGDFHGRWARWAPGPAPARGAGPDGPPPASTSSAGGEGPGRA